MRTYLWSIYSDCKLEILPVFTFQLGHNSMDAHEKILWFWSESFNFTKRHEQESPVYDHVFNDLPLYVHVPLYLEKKPSINIFNALGFWVSLTQNCKHIGQDCGQNNENTCVIVVMLDWLFRTTSTCIETLAHITGYSFQAISALKPFLCRASTVIANQSN